MVGETVKWKWIWIDFTVPGGSLQWGHWYPPHLWIWRRKTDSPGEFSFQSRWWRQPEVDIGIDSWLFKLWRPSLLGKGGCWWHQVWAAVRWKHFSLWRSQWLFWGLFLMKWNLQDITSIMSGPSQLSCFETRPTDPTLKQMSNPDQTCPNLTLMQKFNRMKVSDQTCPNSEYFQWNPWTYILMVDFDTGFWSN